MRVCGQPGIVATARFHSRAAVWCATRWLRMKLSLQDRRTEAIEHRLVDVVRLDPLRRAVMHQAREPGPEILGPAAGHRAPPRPGSAGAASGPAGPGSRSAPAPEHQALDVGPAARARCRRRRAGHGAARGRARRGRPGPRLGGLAEHPAQAAHRRAQIGHLARRQVQPPPAPRAGWRGWGPWDRGRRWRSAGGVVAVMGGLRWTRDASSTHIVKTYIDISRPRWSTACIHDSRASHCQ